MGCKRHRCSPAVKCVQSLSWEWWYHQSHIHNLQIGTNMSWRGTHHFNFQESQGVQSWFYFAFFHFWEPKRLLRERNGWQAALALGRCWLSTLQEKQWLFSQQWLRKNTLAALCHVLAFSLIADCMVSGLFSPVLNSHLRMKEKLTWNTLLHEPLCLKSVLIQSYLPSKETAFSVRKTLLSWNFLSFLGHSQHFQLKWPFVMELSCFSLNNKIFPVSIVIVWISSTLFMMLLVALFIALWKQRDRILLSQYVSHTHARNQLPNYWVRLLLMTT